MTASFAEAKGTIDYFRGAKGDNRVVSRRDRRHTRPAVTLSVTARAVAKLARETVVEIISKRSSPRMERESLR
jgi:hypothetical protein